MNKENLQKQIEEIMEKATELFEKEDLNSSQKNIFFYLYENEDDYDLKCLIKYRWVDDESIENFRYAEKQRAKVKNVAFEIYKMLSNTDLSWKEITRDDIEAGRDFKINKELK